VKGENGQRDSQAESFTITTKPTPGQHFKATRQRGCMWVPLADHQKSVCLMSVRPRLDSEV
jgi:hypothetical protein